MIGLALPVRSGALGLLLLAGLIALAPAAQAEDLAKVKKAFGKAMEAVDAEEAAFWKSTYPDAKRKAHETYEFEWTSNWGLPAGKKEVHYDFSGYRSLVDQYLAIARKRADAFATLGGQGAEGMELLLKYHERVIELTQEKEKALRGSKPQQSFNIFDQRTGMEVAGNELAREALVDAMAKTTGAEAVAVITEAYAKLEKKDRKAHDVRLRDGLLQALARQGDASALTLARTALTDANIAMRVAAVSAITRLSDDDEPRTLLLEHLGTETAHPVIATALDAWRTKAWKKSQAIPVLIDLFDKESEGRAGSLRAHYQAALTALAGIDRGLNPANWRAWMTKHEAAIRDGSYQPPEKKKKKKPESKEPGGESPGGSESKPEGETEESKPEEGESKTEEEEPAAEDQPIDDADDGATVSFFDIKSLSKSVVFLVDASDTLMLPADIDVAKQKAYWEWRTGNPKQLEGIKTQLARLIEECEKTLAALHPTCTFNVVLMMNDYRKQRFQPKPVLATEANKKAALEFLRAAKPSGWASQLSGIFDAMEMAGMSTEANEFAEATCDTVYLLSDGVPCGGWWMDARQVVAAFERANHWRRITVHAVRIANEPASDAETLMQGIARASGGTYVWLDK